jgi:hypothetical protein
VNDKAIFQLTKNCIARINTADSVQIREVSVANSKTIEMQVIGPVAGSKYDFSVETFTISSVSKLIMQDLNVVISGSSSFAGSLNLTNCRATGAGSITVDGSAELVLIRSSSFTLEFGVAGVTVGKTGKLTMISASVLSSSRIQIMGKMEVDVSVIAQLRGEVQECSVLLCYTAIAFRN